MTPWMDIDADLDTLIELVEHRYEAVDREAGKPCLPHARKIRCGQARQFMRTANADALLVEHGNDLRSTDRLQLLRFGIEVAEVRNTLPLPCTSSKSSSFIEGPRQTFQFSPRAIGSTSQLERSTQTCVQGTWWVQLIE